ncbi:MAG TPA: RHS repeat-associated core domain-containing protein [Bryobacteraceae bacterium]|nr:RHS repeat-associated core domain-containing protein [Bryobacteraceae bacterium]
MKSVSVPLAIFSLLAAAASASAQCYQFSAPGVTYTMDVLRVTSGTTSSVLTNLVVSQASTLVVNGTTYVGPVAPANLIFEDSGGVSAVQIAFNQVLQSPVWGVTVDLTGMLDFLPSGVPAAIPPITSWTLKTPTLGVTIAGGALVKYTITAISSCLPGSGVAFDFGKELGDALYQIGCVFCGEPIDIATGNLFEQENDYETSGSNRLAFRRYYNSMSSSVSTLASTLGKNWRSNFDRYLSLSSGKVIVERPDGRQITFTQNGSAWTTDTDVEVRLASSGTTWTLADDNDTVETYRTLNSTEALLQAIVARNGYTQTMAYDASNRLNSVTDSFNRTLAFTYNNGRLATVATPDDTTITFGYDSSSTILTSAAYSTGPATTRKYFYENSSFPAALTAIIDENGNRYTSWTYDSKGRALTSQHADGVDLTTVIYNDTDGTRTVINALGQREIYKFATLQKVSKLMEVDRQASSTVAAATMKYTYDSNGYLASRTDWNGNVTNFVNDVHGQPTSITEAAGTSFARIATISYHSTFHLPVRIVTPGITTSFTYDSNGQMLSRTLTDTTATTVPYTTGGQTRTWTYTYSNFLLASIKTPRTDVAGLTKFTYDSTGALTAITNALNQTTQITSHLPGGLPQSIVDPNGVETDLTYDLRFRLLSRTINTTAGPLTTSYTYDAAGNLLSTTLPDGSSLLNSYDSAHRLISVTDLFHQSIAYVLDPAGDRTQVTVLDASGNPQRTRSDKFDALARLQNDIGGAGQSASFAYDALGNLVTVTDPLSRLTQRVFDALNRPIKVTDPAKGATAVNYDAHDRITSLTDPNGAVTTYVYDGFGELIQQVSSDSGMTVYRYDADGNLAQKVDGAGATQNYSYDALDRVASVSYPADAAENVTCTYDEAGSGFGIGRLTSITDAVGTLSHVYDERGNLLSETRVNSGVTLVTTYTYDVASRVASITYPSGWTVAYTRDAMGRTTGLAAQSPDGSTSLPILTNVAYQPFGPLNTLAFGNGITETRSFDLDYRITNLADNGAGALQNLSYTYDAANNVASITDGVTSTNNQSLGYDSLNRLVNAAGGYGNYAYSYDSVGNRLSENASGSPATFSYTAHTNQLASWNAGGSPQAVSYTKAGNISALAGTTFTYNQANRLATVTVSGNQAAQYTYDGFGHRLVRVGATTATTLYEYGRDGHLLEETDGQGSPLVDYIYLEALPVAALSTATGQVYFLHDDRLGTPQLATDAGQNTAWLANYGPFGEMSTLPSGIVQDLRLPGQEFDVETGLYHNGFRDYVPGWGRYLESDPIGLGGGMNTYAYVEGNPLRLVDPMGLCDTVWDRVKDKIAEWFGDKPADVTLDNLVEIAGPGTEAAAPLEATQTILGSLGGLGLGWWGTKVVIAAIQGYDPDFQAQYFPTQQQLEEQQEKQVLIGIRTDPQSPLYSPILEPPAPPTPDSYPTPVLYNGAMVNAWATRTYDAAGNPATRITLPDGTSYLL